MLYLSVEKMLMNTETKNTVKIGASKTNFNTQVGVIEATQLFQDNMCEYYKKLNCDGVNMVPKCHAFWALTKTKIVFDRDIMWLDDCEIKTNLCKINNARMNLCGMISCDNRESIFCLQEMCGMDSETRGFRPVDSIPFWPKDVDVIDQYKEINFEKFLCDLTEDDYVSSVKIKNSNVDFFGHTNNVEYVKILYDMIDYDYLKNTKPLEFEIHYLKESRLGDELRIYKKQEGDTIIFFIKKNDIVITRARFVFKR